MTQATDASAAYESVPAGTVFFRPAAEGDLQRIHQLEVAGYPADEAASLEQLQYRLREAPELFLVAFEADPAEGDQVVGFVTSTATNSPTLEEESMSVHVQGGHTACIHSVCVDSERRRRGIATKMLAAYVAFIAAGAPHVETARLICKEPLVPLYAGAGFDMVGPSPIVHGKDPWMEMCMKLNA